MDTTDARRHAIHHCRVRQARSDSSTPPRVRGTIVELTRSGLWAIVESPGGHDIVHVGQLVAECAGLHVGELVKVVDPADERRRLRGTIAEVNEGRGALMYLVSVDVDGETERWGCGPSELELDDQGDEGEVIGCDYCVRPATRVDDVTPLCQPCARDHYGAEWRTETRTLGKRARKAIAEHFARWSR